MPSPSAAGKFKQTPLGVIIHGSRSGLDWGPMEEFIATCRYAAAGAGGLGWNATIGPGVLAIHLDAETWGWNAREHSPVFLAVEVAQARLGDPVDDLTVKTLAWYIVNVARARWPDLPDHYPMHSELPAGQRDGKTDLYPPGPEADAFRDRLRQAIASLTAS